MTNADEPKPSGLAGLLILAGIVFGLYGLFRLITRPAGPETAAASRDWIVVPGDSLAYQLRRLDSVEARLGRLRGQMDLIHREAASVDSLQRQAGLRDVAQLRGELAAVRSRVDTLDQIILTDPTRAVQLVLVERDVAQLRESVQGTVVSVRREIDLVYDISKYVIGTMLLLGLGNYVAFRRSR